jgi:hypothetical protein
MAETAHLQSRVVVIAADTQEVAFTAERNRFGA